MIAKQNRFNFPLAILLLAQILTALPINSGSILRIVWFIWIIICFYYAAVIILERNRDGEKKFAVAIIVFWGINFISYLISPRIVENAYVRVETLVILKSITIALFSYFPFYYFAKQSSFSCSSYSIFAVSLLLSAILRIVLGNRLQADSSLEDNNVLNQAYLFAQIIPLFILIFRKRMLYLLVTLAAVFVLWGAKRGAILCMAVNLLVFFVYLFKEDPYGKRHRGSILLIILTIVAICVYYVTDNAFLQERLWNTGTDYDTSGEIRNEMYSTLYLVFSESSPSEIIFGRGLGQTAGIVNNLAHQDWIELLIDNGVIGLLVYLYLIFICIKNVSKCSHLPSAFKYALICCILDWCLTATYSMVYASRDSFILFMTLGIINGCIQQDIRGRIIANKV